MLLPLCFLSCPKSKGSCSNTGIVWVQFVLYWGLARETAFWLVQIVGQNLKSFYSSLRSKLITPSERAWKPVSEVVYILFEVSYAFGKMCNAKWMKLRYLWLLEMGKELRIWVFTQCVGGYYEKRALMCQTCMHSQALFPPPICQYLKNNFITQIVNKLAIFLRKIHPDIERRKQHQFVKTHYPCYW